MKNKIIPKDCLLCDGCNAKLSDENFIAIADSYWLGREDEGRTYSTDLVCTDCYEQYHRKYVISKDIVVILTIKKDMNLSNTDLAKPMIFSTFDESDEIKP